MSDSVSPQNNEPVISFRAARELIEALAVALILAFLFKAYIIELYCIPTGSMASTLMGRHKDVNCEICGFPFQISASSESNDGQERSRTKNELPRVIGGTCPLCQYTMYVDADNLAGQTHMSYSGDRIFVNKSLFSYREPSRWHVTVFRYPAHPHVNYIKRLIGLENETVMLRNGQVFVQKEGSEHFEIQRKPLRALLSMMRPVDDNDHVLPEIHELGWKTRWYGDGRWQRSADYKSFTGTGSAEETSWLKFRYITATTSEWSHLIQGALPEGNHTGTPQLITDSLGYNSDILQFPSGPRREVIQVETPQSGTVQICRRVPGSFGFNWVGDLAIRCTLHADKSEGKVVFRLVKGGIHFQCDLDLAAGDAVFSIPEVPEFVPFSVSVPIHPGRNHDVMFCNVDEEMRLVIDGKEIDTQGRGSYEVLCRDEKGMLSRDRSPTVLDLEPAAIGMQGTYPVIIEHIKIMRNLYYISCDISCDGRESARLCDLVDSPFGFTYSFDYEENVKKILSSPRYWTNFGKTRQTFFPLGKDQFLMCGDNSAQSQDSRLWTFEGIPHYVERKYLIGEALFVFWPHGHRIPGTKLALIPNFPKMRWID
ncbi:MAG: S26 family signal peptidase [Planctomycetaceae bacterium]|nr:S26 family signal peptidase [Planctomycetaceae bacterium]